MNSAEIWDARGCARRVTRNFAELPGPPRSAPARARELSPHWQGVASRCTYPRTNAQKDSELGMRQRWLLRGKTCALRPATRTGAVYTYHSSYQARRCASSRNTQVPVRDEATIRFGADRSKACCEHDPDAHVLLVAVVVAP